MKLRDSHLAMPPPWRAAAALATITALVTACGGAARVSDDPLDGAPPADGPGAAAPRGDSSTGDGGPSASAGDTADGGDVSVAPFVPLTGTQTLIDLFPVAGGALVVTSESVLRVDRRGAVRASWRAPREITAAAWDGSNLGVADKAALSALDINLNVLTMTFLTETCGAAVAVSSARFVCGPDIDWERPFYVYDMKKGQLLAKSSRTFTYQGASMQRIPGTDDFLTEEAGSFYLYNVDSESALSYIGQSNDPGQLVASATIAFIGSPVDHLLNENGVLLALRGSVPDGGTTPPSPLVRDGILGTLGETQSFVALDRASADVVALVANEYASCATGCALQHIDVAARTITSSRTRAVTAERVVLLRHDAPANAAWVGTSPNSIGPGGTTGYRVELLAY